MTATAVASLYGCYSTLVLPLFHALPTLTTAVSTSLLPTLSAMEGAGKSTEAKKITMFALLMTAGVSLMATLVLAFGGEMILHLIFPHQPTAVESATPWLSCIAWGIPFACLSGVLGGILQAEGHPVRPVIATGTGILVKGVLSYVLLSNPAMGILGVAVSTVLADILIFLILVGMMMKLTPWLCGLGKRDSVAMAVPSLPKTK